MSDQEIFLIIKLPQVPIFSTPCMLQFLFMHLKLLFASIYIVLFNLLLYCQTGNYSGFKQFSRLSFVLLYFFFLSSSILAPL